MLRSVALIVETHLQHIFPSNIKEFDMRKIKYKCRECCKVFAELDAQYIADYPSASEDHLSSLKEEHDNRDCPQAVDEEVVV